MDSRQAATASPLEPLLLVRAVWRWKGACRSWSQIAAINDVRHGPPKPQNENGADRGDEKIAQPAVKFDIQQAGERTANERAGDANQQIGEKTDRPPS